MNDTLSNGRGLPPPTAVGRRERDVPSPASQRSDASAPQTTFYPPRVTARPLDIASGRHYLHAGHYNQAGDRRKYMR